jgi:hypothetical protein
LHAARHQPDALVEADQPEAAAFLRVGEVEALSIVGDSQLDDFVPPRRQGDLNPVRLGVPRRVVERLLRHAIQTQCDVRRDLQPIVGVEHDVDPALIGELDAGSLERRDEPEVLEHRGVQLVRKVANRLGRSERLPLDAGELQMALDQVRREASLDAAK